MANVLSIAGPALGHIMRILAISNVLRNETSVHFSTDSDVWKHVILEYGYEYEPLPSIIGGSRLEQGSIRTEVDYLQRALEADIALIRQHKPRVIVLDWRPSMRLAAAICNVPVVAITNAHLTPYYLGPLAAPFEHPIVQQFGQRFGDLIMPFAYPLSMKIWGRNYQSLARKYQFKAWADLRAYAIGDVTLYPDLPMLTPVVPNKGRFIGPITQAPITEKLPPLRGPVLYITGGSDDMDSYVSEIANIAEDWPGDVVVTQGGWKAKGDVWPRHWIVRKYINPSDIYEQGHRAVWLYHGGNGSSYQILHYWVHSPTQTLGVIALPFHVEQQWNANKLRQMGIVHNTYSIKKIFSANTQMRIHNDIHGLLQQPAQAPPQDLVREVTYYQNAIGTVVDEVRKWL